MIIVSDDLPGISEVIKTLFPLSDHQLCYVHLERNVRKNMKKEDAKDFNKELKKVKDSSYAFEDSIEVLFFNLFLQLEIKDTLNGKNQSLY